MAVVGAGRILQGFKPSLEIESHQEDLESKGSIRLVVTSESFSTLLVSVGSAWRVT
jgi:hypothetical protein